MAQNLTKICTRLYSEDHNTLMEICATQNIEFANLIRNVVHQYCLVARANANRQIDKNHLAVQKLEPANVG